MTDGDPVSWFLIEHGWKVVDSGGEEIGTVDEIAGDSSDDIFNGLSVATSMLGSPRYVPSEQVAEIREGTVHLKLSKDEVHRLGEFREPPTTAEVLPEDAGVVRRTEAAVEAPIHTHSERLNPLTRMWHALRRMFGR
jgi:hypothetical protein